MSVNQNPMESIKKIAKFFWRHCFTLADLSLSINVFIYGDLLWKNALISVAIAITIDWVKKFIKLTPNPDGRHFNDMDDAPIHTRQPWNSSLIGTPTNLMNMGQNRYN